MELWMNLLFGNWIGLLSMFTIALSLIIPLYMWVMFIKRSNADANKH
ncbi:MAG TPA: DUF3149 domain-containing protein [Gammaproteobacteria bacterium]|jgi:hypothetical protein|nr:DUF3149 domain-containing protein [Gammaproteobacteria bacterium]